MVLPARSSCGSGARADLDRRASAAGGRVHAADESDGLSCPWSELQTPLGWLLVWSLGVLCRSVLGSDAMVVICDC